MLSIEQIAGHVARLSYRPGWEFEVYQGQWEGPHVAVRCEVEDSEHPGDTVTLSIHSPIPPVNSTVELERWLQWRLIRVESHESREWLKRDGVVVFDPHAPLANEDRP